MGPVLGLVLLAPAAFLPRSVAMREQWQPFTSIDSRVRFEMPLAPQEQLMKAPDGTRCRIFACTQNDLVFQVVAIDMSQDLQLALKEVVAEDEVSTTRQLLDDAIGGFVDATKGKMVANDYQRFQKFPARATTVTFADREAKALAVVGDTKAYIFTVTYAKGTEGKSRAKRFFDSVIFKS